MRSVWIALALIVGGSLLGALLLLRLVDRPNHPKSLLAPRGARVLEERSAGASTIVAWRIGGHPEMPSLAHYGVTIWQGKHRLYEHRAALGTSDIRLETGRFGDYDSQTGCGLYRGFVTGAGSLRQRVTQVICGRRGSVHIRNGAIVIRVGKHTTEVRS
jgi:hypothetical protein